MEQVHTSSLNADELPSTLLSEGKPEPPAAQKESQWKIKESKLRGLLKPGIWGFGKFHRFESLKILVRYAVLSNARGSC